MSVCLYIIDYYSSVILGHLRHFFAEEKLGNLTERIYKPKTFPRIFVIKRDEFIYNDDVINRPTDRHLHIKDEPPPRVYMKGEKFT